MPNDALTEQTTRHAVYVERLKASEVAKFSNFLKRMDRDIRARLGGTELTEFSRTRLERLLAQLNRDLVAIWTEWMDELGLSLNDIAVYESEFESRSLGKVIANVETVAPPPEQVLAAVSAAPLAVRGPGGGSLLEPFLKDFTATERRKLIGAIRQGYYEGQTNSQILRRVRGTRANRFTDGILHTTNRAADAIVRTSVQHVAGVARVKTWEANSDIITGYRWVSTLDGRTTQQCRSLDGRLFELGRGPLPPIHIRCRSTTVAELDDRYAAADSGQRASKDGPVNADLSYYEWLKRQPAAFQDDALGPTKAKLFRSGGLSAERFSALNLNRDFQPLTLSEMRAKEPAAFERAGI